MGSTGRRRRRAGSQQAMSATTMSTSPTAAKVSGFVRGDAEELRAHQAREAESEKRCREPRQRGPWLLPDGE